MTLTGLRSTIGHWCRQAIFWIKANRLNMSVLFLGLRLWWVKTRIKALLSLIEDAKEKLHQACQRDANHAFATVKQNTSLSSLGLSRVIVNALERVKIHNLRDLAPNMYNLEAIPNIGPSRAETIKSAFEESIKQAARKSCHTLQMVELTKNHVVFRVSLTATIDHLLSKQDALKSQVDDYYADPETYCVSGAYREELNRTKGRLINDAVAFIEEVRAIRKKAHAGQFAFAPHRLTEKNLQELAAVEWRKIPLSFDIKYFRQIEILGGSIRN
jgi:hypothetical protein